jgi:DNA-binding beta-propeller fold protein YncE
MPLTAVAPPHAVPIIGGFDYVTVDPARRRIYAAHTASEALLIVDADTGAIVGQVRVGPMHGVAVDPATGHVFTGNGTDQSVSEIDPVALKVLRSVDVAGNVDAIAYDPANGHIYADEDDGTHLFVVDAKTMTSVGTVALPGHKPEYLAVDPKTHDVYQNITDLAEVAVIDATTLTVKRTIPTPAIVGNHPLQFDSAYGHLLVGGQNGTIAAYDRAGTLVGTVAIQARVDQCSLDETNHELACAGSGKLSVVRDLPSGAPVAVTSTTVPAGAHTVGYDPKAGRIWIVWAQPDGGDFVQAYASAP